MPFKNLKSSSFDLETPEALFRDLRSKKVQGLLSHQADILRLYIDQAVEKGDVAFQLPTGSGKTLVGLLLGEWRRLKFQERVIYLCPTNQLVNQVATQAATKYGLRAIPFTGKKIEYLQSDKADYQSGEAIAVTSYSSLFNTDPFFDDPHIIILDDAHSAENYIAKHWSLDIRKKEFPVLFNSLASILHPILSETDYLKLTSDHDSQWDSEWVDKIPSPSFASLISELTETLDTYVKDTSLRFPWKVIRDHLTACHLYYSSREILIRPLIPPTATHNPFVNAKQRIYMSATLGEGGELERLTGRKAICRLPIPTGWDKQGIGRRLFLFPGRTLDEVQSSELVVKLIKAAGRSLVITAEESEAAKFRDVVTNEIQFRSFTAREIEHSKKSFIEEPQAVAVIANRYDGIDFPDAECRLLIIEGISRSTNLQEKFLISRMGASIIFNDRILTRIQQAFGRCTRSATDYATVVIRDENLLAFLLKVDRQKLFHPELQAEITFGLEQSKYATLGGDFLEFFQILSAQGTEWSDADNEIIAKRKHLKRENNSGNSDLQHSVASEIDYQYSLWKGDFIVAADECRKVLGELSDPGLKSYRILWNYLAGSACWLAYKQGETGFDVKARDYFKNAHAATGALRWLNNLTRIQDESQEVVTEELKVFVLIERLERTLEILGKVHDRKFAAEEKFILEGLAMEDSRRFEAAHMRLGNLLGYSAGKVEEDGSPDPWWIADEHLCFVFEDHSGGNLSVTKARQAASHPNWIKAKLPECKNAKIIPILVTPVKEADNAVLLHLENVCYWDINDFRKWATKALAVIRDLRRDFTEIGDVAWREKAAQVYIENGLAPEGLVKWLQTQLAADILRRK